LTTYYWCNIPNFAEIIASISDLIKSQVPNVVDWGEKQERAFNQIKQVFSKEPILELPDLERPFVVQSDASS